jgi:putative ABC transport system ATP-binding protein
MIKLKNVSKTYKSGKIFVNALRYVTLEILKGDFIVVNGPSGSGKSTMLNILGLLDEPTEGDVILNNKKISFDDFDALADVRAKSISFIFQSFNLNPVLTLKENVMVPLIIRSDIKKPEKERRATEWIENTGLTPFIHHKPDELSGGQRQRVAIARAMVSEPELVIADEPTANLDSQTTRSILEFMKELNEKKRTSFIFATHDPVLKEYSKRTITLRDGEIKGK